jgi:hypothetical protein
VSKKDMQYHPACIFIEVLVTEAGTAYHMSQKMQISKSPYLNYIGKNLEKWL